MYAAKAFSFFAILLSVLPAASAYYAADNDYDLLSREAYGAGGLRGAYSSIMRRNEEDELDLLLAAREILDEYEENYAFYARGNSQSSQAKKAKIKAAEENLAHAKAALADAIKDGNERIINGAKMNLMNAQGALEFAKKG